MKQHLHNLSLFDWKWDWHVVYRKDHDDIIQLVATLEKERPPVSVDWPANETMEFHLMSQTGLIDDYPGRAEGKQTYVQIHDPTGAEWRHVLQWTGIGAMEKFIARPPVVNARFHRIVSPELKDILEGFHLPPHEFIPAKVRHSVTNEVRPYYFFHLIADDLTELEQAYWPAMTWHIEHRLNQTVLHTGEKGSAQNLDEAIQQYRQWIDQNFPRIPPVAFKIPELVYMEPYDLAWSEGWMTLSDALAEAIRSKLGEEYIGPWTGRPTCTGFDPKKANEDT